MVLQPSVDFSRITDWMLGLREQGDKCRAAYVFATGKLDVWTQVQCHREQEKSRVLRTWLLFFGNKRDGGNVG